MSGPRFFETRMGQQFYDETMPRLVREVARLNDNLERLLAFVEPTPASATEILRRLAERTKQPADRRKESR